MYAGKQKCEALKDLRLQIARNNDIDYQPGECTHQGDCLGSCPACESEVRYIEKQLALRRAAGKAIKVFGVMASMTLMTSCNPFGAGRDVRGKVPAERMEKGEQQSQNTKGNEGQESPEVYMLEGDVPNIIEEESDSKPDDKKK